MAEKPSFEYCSVRFLEQWVRREKRLYEAFSTTPTPEDICEALSYFKVSRNFAGIDDPGKQKLVLASLKATLTNSKLPGANGKVCALAKKFEQDFKFFNLSAASKLLWLSSRTPFIIYDRRAVKALRSFRFYFQDRDYDAYTNAWRTQFNSCAKAIGAATRKLPKVKAFMHPSIRFDPKLVKTIREPWFKERVFDLYLWETGE
jgi:hypothetical protein